MLEERQIMSTSSASLAAVLQLALPFGSTLVTGTPETLITWSVTVVPVWAATTVVPPMAQTTRSVTNTLVPHDPLALSMRVLPLEHGGPIPPSRWRPYEDVASGGSSDLHIKWVKRCPGPGLGSVPTGDDRAELGARADAQFAVGPGQRGLDRAAAHEEPPCDLGVGEALGSQHRDPLLGVGELHRSAAHTDAGELLAGLVAGPIDGLALAVGLLGIGFEWIADAQLRAFVTGPKKPGETLRTGLWRYSRHPNYLGEMLVWWSLWLFGFAADPVWGQWAIAAPLAISAMFLFVSIPLIEKRSLERRANYQQVIDETSMLIPMPPRGKARRTA